VQFYFPFRGWKCRLVVPLTVALTVLFAPSNAPPAVPAALPVPAATSRGVSLDTYRARLRSLDQLVTACQSEIGPAKEAAFVACEAKPDGLQPLAGTGSIWIVPRAAWQESEPEIRSAYTCGGQPVVVEYPVGRGHAVWWASSMPLENGSIVREQNMELLFNSIGPTQGHRIYWDESLHGQAHTPWDYVSGPVWPLLFFGALGLALLVVWSFSRRSAPVRALPHAPALRLSSF
jgi:hypothetical protein